MFERVFDVDPSAGEAELRAQVEKLEQLKSAAAAAQARATALWAARRRAAEVAAGVPAKKRGKGLTSEIALARSDAPVCGNTHLGMARALVHEMPHTLSALECGALSEWRATLIVRESACLSVEDRGRLDAELCADVSKLDGWGNNRIEAEARKITARLDAAAVVARSARAPKDRCVTIRPAPDTMAYVTALLPVAQGVAVFASLTRAADTTVDERSRSQVMADTFTERVTGRPAEQPVPVSLNLVLADTTLLGDDEAPGWCDGYGPVPAAVVRALVSDAVADEAAKATLRRLYRHPSSGQLVAMESKARRFPKGLAEFIGIRDRTCRTPYCNAPIRHRDHAVPHHRGGPTSAVNGLGDCEACNYAKEARDWTVTTTDDGGHHRAEFRTPTGATYRSTAPPLPGPPIRTRSVMEDGLGIDVVRFSAA
ncbi:13E12 repeat family protein [Mycolicibacterium sp. F2034L]|uniref:HNH endonuclease n=1 Tax=Mycolicibacterium sp. F2034L TaxID=2926422 RepID=UPI001FF17B8B|nr:13E12 repeat family protein [Mycolicibacterium sp. F2034L]MCK0176837.1 13E12 repeat family protein [Mycolicibacterium sp. F2034L]